VVALLAGVALTVVVALLAPALGVADSDTGQSLEDEASNPWTRQAARSLECEADDFIGIMTVDREEGAAGAQDEAGALATLTQDIAPELLTHAESVRRSGDDQDSGLVATWEVVAAGDRMVAMIRGEADPGGWYVSAFVACQDYVEESRR
jgi:hypothetical protein